MSDEDTIPTVEEVITDMISEVKDFASYMIDELEALKVLAAQQQEAQLAPTEAASLSGGVPDDLQVVMLEVHVREGEGTEGDSEIVRIIYYPDAESSVQAFAHAHNVEIDEEKMAAMVVGVKSFGAMAFRVAHTIHAWLADQLVGTGYVTILFQQYIKEILEDIYGENHTGNESGILEIAHMMASDNYTSHVAKQLTAKEEDTSEELARLFAQLSDVAEA